MPAKVFKPYTSERKASVNLIDLDDNDIFVINNLPKPDFNMAKFETQMVHSYENEKETEASVDNSDDQNDSFDNSINEFEVIFFKQNFKNM